MVLTRRSTRILAASAFVTTLGGVYVVSSRSKIRRPETDLNADWKSPAPFIKARSDLLADLKASNTSNSQGDGHVDPYDILIIGGGATGTGIALDAASRGMKVALIERDDFASGTSSKSTKLIHGGVRYLEKAVLNLDYEQYKLVREALRERRSFIDMAPHLTSWLPILMPVREWWRLPYLWAGTKMYDLIAGFGKTPTSYYLTKQKALSSFPMLNGSDVSGAIVYHDGSQDDARMNISLAVTAALHGATTLNHIEVVRLTKDGEDKIDGVFVRDRIGPSDAPFQVSAKCVINATGALCDTIRMMDDQSVRELVRPSSGVHVTLPEYCTPPDMGLIDPSSPDGRVVFVLPWQGRTIAGTTDKPCEAEHDPIPAEEDIQWILERVSSYLRPDVSLKRTDVLSAWSGIRPLIQDPAATTSEQLVRNHYLTISPSGLITIAGGKWTTFREMAEKTVDFAIEQCVLGRAGACQTADLKLIGAHRWSPTLFIRLMQDYKLQHDEAQHLASAYGDRAWQVVELCSDSESQSRRIVASHPFLDGEIRYAVRYEFSQHVFDTLARRMRLAFLDARAAIDSVPVVVKVMAEELGWSSETQKKESQIAISNLKSML